MNRFLKRVKNYSFLSFLGHFSIFLFYSAGFFILFVVLVFVAPTIKKYGFFEFIPDYAWSELFDFHSSFFRSLVIFSFFAGFLTTLITTLLKLEFAVFQFMLLIFFGQAILRFLPVKLGLSLIISSFSFRFSLKILTSLFLSLSAFILFRSFYQKKKSYSSRHSLGNFLACFGLLFTSIWFNQWWQAPLKKTSNVVDERFADLPVLSSEQLKVRPLIKLQQDYQYLKSQPVTDFEKQPPNFTYLVKPGDSYWEIAKEVFNDPLRWKDISDQTNSAVLQPDDKIKITLKSKDYPQYLDYLVDEWIFPGSPLAVLTHNEFLYLLIGNQPDVNFLETIKTSDSSKIFSFNYRASLLIFKSQKGSLELISSTEIPHNIPYFSNYELYHWRSKDNCEQLAISGGNLPLQIAQICKSGEEINLFGPTENLKDFHFIDIHQTYNLNFPSLLALTTHQDKNNEVVLLDMHDLNNPQIVARKSGEFNKFIKDPNSQSVSLLGNGGLHGLIIMTAWDEGDQEGQKERYFSLEDQRHLATTFKGVEAIEKEKRYLLYYKVDYPESDKGYFTIEKQEPFNPSFVRIKQKTKLQLLEGIDPLGNESFYYLKEPGFFIYSQDGSSPLFLFSKDNWTHFWSIEKDYYYQTKLPVTDGLNYSQTYQSDSGLIYKIGCRQDSSVNNRGRLIVLDFDK